MSDGDGDGATANIIFYKRYVVLFKIKICLILHELAVARMPRVTYRINSNILIHTIFKRLLQLIIVGAGTR